MLYCDTINPKGFTHGQKYCDIHDEVKIDFEVPSVLQEILDMAEESDLSQDGNYYNLVETIFSLSKNLCADGIITRKQWDTILQRYL